MIENQQEKINERLIRVRKSLGLTQKQFADTLEYKQGHISELETGAKNISKAIMYALEDKVNVNRKWLETGDGLMFKVGNDNQQSVEKQSLIAHGNNRYGDGDIYDNRNDTIVKPDGIITSVNSNRRKSSVLIPFYNTDFMAGRSDEFYEDGVIHPEYYMDVPEFSGCTAFRAYSDSMETRIKSGNILFGTKIEDWISHLEYGQIYGITCTDGRRYLKYIRKSKEDKKCFLLKSENVNYDDFEIPKVKIKNIWLIEGWLDKRT